MRPDPIDVHTDWDNEWAIEHKCLNSVLFALAASDPAHLQISDDIDWAVEVAISNIVIPIASKAEG